MTDRNSEDSIGISIAVVFLVAIILFMSAISAHAAPSWVAQVPAVSAPQVPIETTVQGLNPGVDAAFSALPTPTPKTFSRGRFNSAAWVYRAAEVGDLATSLYGFRHGATEGNPILVPLMHFPPAFIAARLLMGEWAIRTALKHRQTTGLLMGAGAQALIDLHNLDAAHAATQTALDAATALTP